MLDASGRPWNETFDEAEQRGFRLQLQARAVVLLVVAASFFFTVTLERALFYATFAGLLAALGWVVDRTVVRLRGGGWRVVAAALILIDIASLSVVLALPSLVTDHPWPPQVALRFSSVLYLMLYVMGSALTTSPVLVLWTGVSAAATWSACVWWIIRQPGTITVGNLRLIDTEIGIADQLRIFLDPRFVNIVAFQTQLLVLLLGSALLAFGVWRSRRFLREQTRFAAERQSLARFVPTDLADDLAAGPKLGEVRRKPVTVMFADIVGYTAIVERMEPEAALRLLGQFHGRMTQAVLAHGGTVDKFMGDAVMATFGTGRRAAGPDAGRALACVLAANDALADWNRERAGGGEDVVRFGIGLHCGEALVGTVGAAQRLEHTVIGDVVNVASRLERLTREQETPLLVSEAIFAEAGREGVDAARLDRFESVRLLAVRGREEGIRARPLINPPDRA